MVSDLTTLDSMIQRLGRVNRRGGPGRCAQVDVVFRKDGDASADKASPFEQAAGATGRILSRWAQASGDGLDVSPRNLQDLIGALDENERIEAFSPKPPVPPLTDILLDAWSLTSVREPMPGRPEVAPYLHGLTSDPAETFVAWRTEVGLLAESAQGPERLRDWFLACRIEGRERLRDRTYRVHDELKKIAKRRGDERTPVIVLDERGNADLCELAALLSRGVSGLAYRTVLLPTEAGGLSDAGMLDADSTGPVEDVADTAEGKGVEARRERWLCIRDQEGERYERLISGEASASLPRGLRERQRVVLGEPVEGAEEEGESRCLLLMVQPRQAAQDDPESVRTNQSLGDHTRQVVECVKRMAGSLGLDPLLEDALCRAAEWHDRGKSRPTWQRYAGNPDPGKPLAKSAHYLPARLLGRYRHEFGSLLEAGIEPQVQNHPEADLVLHLIAAHHGWGRPHFERRAADSEAFSGDDNQRVAVDVMRRFGRLQQRFGRWGLAWLESLLRCADIAASKQAAQGQTESPVKEAPA
jgi:CRISPR-associated endonuclease/helicase Cas3